MKKLLSIAVCASAVAAFATDTEIALGTVGVTAITSTFTNTVVAVSYKELGDADGNITVSNIVKTANLAENDLLYVFNDGKYQSYTLKVAGGVKYWDRTLDYVVGGNGNLTTDGTPAANIATLAAGSGIWLVRSSAWDGNEFTFYIYGKPSSVTSVDVAAGKTALVGNPTQTSKPPTISGATSGDQLLVPAHNKVGMLTYTYNGTQWSGKVNKAWVHELPSIPAGTGFWYVAKGAVTINW